MSAMATVATPRPAAKDKAQAGLQVTPFREDLRRHALDQRCCSGGQNLYPYQQTAVEKVLAAWNAGQHMDALVSLPVGTGKSEIGIRLLRLAPPGTRSLFLVHRRDLVTQFADRLKLRYPDLSNNIGLLRGGEAQLDRPITVGTIQSLAGTKHRPLAKLEPLLQAGPIDMLIVDEAHHCANRSYTAALAALRERNPKLRHLGLTATPIFEGKMDISKIYHLVEYKTVRWAVEHGYLVPPVGLKVVTDLDLDSVKQRNGDFDDESLGKTLNTPGFNRLAVKIYREYLRGLHTLVFCATVAHAKAIVDEFRAAHVPTELIVADTKDDERKAAVDAFTVGEVMVLVNVGVLTEGIDIPASEALLMLRPTKSPVLYIQAVGRVLRLAPGKTHATVVDFTSSGQTLYTLDDMMEGAFTQKEVEATQIHRKGSPHVVTRPAQGTGDEPAQFWTHVVDLLRSTPLAWYTGPGGRSVMPVENGYALLMPPGGPSAKTHFEQILAAARSGRKTDARAECLEWQLEHLDCYTLYYLHDQSCEPVDWDREYGMLISVASSWAESRKSNSLSTRSAAWRSSLATPNQLKFLADNHVIDSEAWLAEQEAQAGARLSTGLASCLISWLVAMRSYRKCGFAAAPAAVQAAEDKAIRFRRLLLEQGVREEEIHRQESH